jgi:hypothetical protein
MGTCKSCPTDFKIVESPYIERDDVAYMIGGEIFCKDGDHLEKVVKIVEIPPPKLGWSMPPFLTEQYVPISERDGFLPWRRP